jgi:hypothetical protein
MQKMKEVNDAAKLLEVTDEQLFEKFTKRQEPNAFRYIQNNRYKPIDITTTLQKKYREQYEELEGTFDNLKFTMPYDDTTRDMLNSIKDILREMPLDGKFNDYINPSDWLLDTRAQAPGGEQQVARAPLPPTPMPDQQVVQPTPQVAQGNAGVMQNGLTPTESALLSESEKVMRLRQRGLA